MAPHDIDLWAYGEDALPASERERAELHLVTCPQCRDGVADARAAQTALRQARGVPIVVQWAAVNSTLHDEVERRLHRRPAWTWAAGALAAASAAAVVMLTHVPKPTPVAPPPMARSETLPPVSPPRPPLPSPAAGNLADASTVVSAQGALRWSERGKREPLHSGEYLSEGEGIETPKQGSAMLRMPDSSRVRLSAGTEVLVARSKPDEVALVLGTGRITAQAAHVPRKEFRIQAGSVVVRIVGTVFSIAANPTEVDVAVAEGKVKVELPTGGERFVSAGHSLRIRREQARPGTLSGVELGEFKRLGVDTAKLETAAPVPAIDASPQPIGVPSDRAQVATPLITVDAPVPSSSVPATLTPAPAAAALPTPPAAATPRPPLPSTVEEIFLRRADESLRNGKCEAILPGLGELADRAEEPATKSHARILRARCFDDRLKPLEAHREYKRYLDEFPEGPFAPEARSALVE